MRRGNGTNARSANSGVLIRRSRPNSGRSDWTEPQKEGDKSRNRSDPTLDLGQVERLRTTLVGAQQSARWERWAILGGALLLGLSIFATLFLAARTDARADRLVASDAAQVRIDAATAARIEGKLDGTVTAVDTNSGKIDGLKGDVETLAAALATTTTAPRTVPRSPIPPTTAPAPVPTVPQGTVPTIPPPPPTTPPTTAPCRFLIILPC